MSDWLSPNPPNISDPISLINLNMEHKWEIITDDLYQKIEPIGGELFSRIDEQFKRKKTIRDAWVEFDMNDFIYMDPFYGEQKSTAPFRMNFGLWYFLEQLSHESILQIENKTFLGEKEDCFGSFSNSLYFTIPEMKFGKITENKTIEFEMTYSLTNSDSYGMMSGTIKDHIKKTGQFKTLLQVKDLIINKSNSKNIQEILKSLNSQYYDINGMYEAKDLNWSSPDCTSYYIPYADSTKSDKRSKIIKNKPTWWKKFSKLK